MADYLFPSENQIEVYVTKYLSVGIKEIDTYGNGDQVIIISRERLPKLIAWLKEIQVDLNAGKYKAEAES